MKWQSNATGIDNYSNQENNLITYPNPTFDILTLNWEDKSDQYVSIINQLGQIVFKEKVVGNNEYSIDLSIYPKGLYYVSINNKEGNFKVQKIVKQ